MVTFLAHEEFTTWPEVAICGIVMVAFVAVMWIMSRD